ncbi:hypothetical protein EVAR_75053_1 [Eumeta japonica]|uniref:Uncharacterized protein n=1 Tax=Eumeta variegata TaxID=151549 RepID=A0A4C1VZB6_EUMVA|nr:hypothetical protein EVAR_75053_1 [Eumeta japonica]
MLVSVNVLTCLLKLLGKPPYSFCGSKIIQGLRITSTNVPPVATQHFYIEHNIARAYVNGCGRLGTSPSTRALRRESRCLATITVPRAPRLNVNECQSIALSEEVTRARRTASADWWITPGTTGMRPRDLFTTSRDYRESVGVIFH